MPDKGLADLQYDNTMAHDIRFDPDDSAPTYIGLHRDTVASDTAVNWIIYKFTYSGSNTTRIQKQVGVWNNRASLTWE